MAGSDSSPSLGRYSSRAQAIARRATRLLLLRPYVWRLLKVSVHGQERVESAPDTFIVVANHSSHFDTPLIFGALPSRLSRYLSAGAAADYWFNNWWRAASASVLFNAFPVDRRGKRNRGNGKDEAGTPQNPREAKANDPETRQERKSHRGLAAELLNDGVPILLFPEGGRTYTGAMGRFTPGAAGLALKKKVPVVPVAIVGAYAAWPPSQKHLPKGRPPVHVVLGEPMYAEPGEIAYQFNERVRRRVIEMHDATARAYGMRTLEEYARTVELEKSRRAEAKKGADEATSTDPSAVADPTENAATAEDQKE